MGESGDRGRPRLRADDIVGVRVRDLVEPVDRDAWQALVGRLFDDPSTPVRGTFRCRHKDGSVRWTEGVARNLLQEPRVGGIVVYYRDVTARKATEQQLKETEDRYGHLFSSAADVIFEADAEGYFRFVNPQTLRLFEFEQDEVIGRRFTEFIRADYRPQILQHYYQQTTEAAAEFLHRVPGGHEVRQGSLARTERVDHHRLRPASSSACRRWRATSPNVAAAKTPCGPPRQNTAPSSSSR